MFGIRIIEKFGFKTFKLKETLKYSKEKIKKENFDRFNLSHASIIIVRKVDSVQMPFRLNKKRSMDHKLCWVFLCGSFMTVKTLTGENLTQKVIWGHFSQFCKIRKARIGAKLCMDVYRKRLHNFINP